MPLGPEAFPANVDPLTGSSADDPSLLDRRPVLARISPLPFAGRPQAGQAYTDLVWEQSISEGATCFVALFYGWEAPQVRPMPSARLADGQIAPLYGGILGLASGDKYTLKSAYAAQGKPSPFRAGSTWFDIVGRGSTARQFEPDSWKAHSSPGLGRSAKRRRECAGVSIPLDCPLPRSCPIRPRPVRPPAPGIATRCRRRGLGRARVPTRRPGRRAS